MKFPREVDSARRSMKWRAEFFTLDVIPRTNRNDSISTLKMIQGIKVALFLSTYFPVSLRPNSAGNKDCCGFVTCYFILPLKVSLFHIFLISLDRVEQCDGQPFFWRVGVSVRCFVNNKWAYRC